MRCPKCNVGLLDDSGSCSHCGSRTPSSPTSDSEATRTLDFSPTELQPGTVVGGKFRIAGILGQGGMGVVYRAEDSKLHRTVALKFLPAEFGASSDARARFVMEARAAAALTHPNICTIHEIHDAEERPFLELEFVEGESLRNKLRDGPLPVEEAVAIAIQVAEGLEEAHGKGIVHRDIKSANIMVTAKGQAKIMDFGLAKVRGETLYTKEGTTLGTAAYMSPEQARGEAVDHRTDLWSLGVVLYEMVSGRRPFVGERDAPILYAVVHEAPKPLKGGAAEVPEAIERIIRKALEKKPESRYGSASEMLKDLRKYRDSVQAERMSAFNLRALRKPKLAIPAAAALVLLLAGGGWWAYWQSKARWAREVALPEAQRLWTDYEPGYSNVSRAYDLVLQARRYIPQDREVLNLMALISRDVSIKSEPPGAAVYIREISAPVKDWRYLGRTPIGKVRLPAGHFWWRIEKQGYETVMVMAPSHLGAPRYDRVLSVPFAANNLVRTLDPKGQLPPGMVRVQGAKTPAGTLEDFFIDKHEVTNRQFREFVQNGGYREQKYWKHGFVKQGQTLTWGQAMAEFVDQSGRVGPSTWSAGDYPSGREDYPVSGVSWYEAAAYAEYAGKTLPTGYHWGAALGAYERYFRQLGWIGSLIHLSNFNGEGPALVGSHEGVTPYGAYDMGGNVREWCWNQTSAGRVVRGGAWNDAHYMINSSSQADAFDRSPRNGFRCARYINASRIPLEAFAPYQPAQARDYYREAPAADAVFEVYRAQYDYDKAPLNAKVEWRGEGATGSIKEKVTFDGAYGNERVTAYLWLPKDVAPPYQAVIFFPGANVWFLNSSQRIDWDIDVSYIVKNGRAVICPILNGTFERRVTLDAQKLPAGGSQQREVRIQWVQDCRRCIDYLETRSDFDKGRLAYLGVSWGGWMAPLVLAVEKRIKAGVLVNGGVNGSGRPEVNPVHFIPRVKQPTLMLNGRYDTQSPYESAAKPLHDLLGTPPEHKRLRVYETDHFVPRNELVKETLAWLDRYLGPVK